MVRKQLLNEYAGCTHNEYQHHRIRLRIDVDRTLEEEVAHR